MATAASNASIDKLINDKVNKVLNKFNNTSKSVVKTFTNLDRSITGLVFRFTLLSSTLAAPLIAVRGALQAADQQYTTFLSGAAGLVAGTKQSLAIGEYYMQKWNSIVERTSADIGANFEGASKLVANTIDDVKNALGNGKTLTVEQIKVLDEYAKKTTLFSKIAEGTGTDPSFIAGGLSQFIQGKTSLKELSRLDAFSETKIDTYVRQRLTEMGVTEKTATGTQRAQAFMQAVDTAFPDEMVERLKKRPQSVFSRWRLFLFGMEKGVLSLNKQIKSLGKFQGNDIDTGAEAFYYFLTKLGEFFTKLARAFGIKPEDFMQTISSAVMNLGKTLEDWGLMIDALSVEVKQKGVLGVLKSRISSVFDSVSQSIASFIDNTIVPALFVKNKEGDIVGLSSYVGEATKDVFKFFGSIFSKVTTYLQNNDIGSKAGTFLNGIVESISGFVKSPGGTKFIVGIGAALGSLVNVITKALEGADLKLAAITIAEAAAKGLAGAIMIIDWQSAVKVAVDIWLIATAVGAIKTLGLTIVGGILSGSVFNAIALGAVKLATSLASFWISIATPFTTAAVSSIPAYAASFMAAVVSFWTATIAPFLAAIAPILAFGAALSVAIAAVFTGISLLFGLISRQWEGLSNWVRANAPWLYNALSAVWNSIRSVFNWAVNKVDEIFPGFKNNLTRFTNLLIDVVNWGVGLLQRIPGLGDQLKQIDKLQESSTVQQNVQQNTNTTIVGNAAFGNYPTWYNAIQKEMSLAPAGAKPVIANDSELIIPRNQISNRSDTATVVNKNYTIHAPINIKGDIGIRFDF